MKKLILLPLVLMATHSFADELHNFDQVKAAVTTGKSVRIAIDFLKCTTSKKDAAQAKFSMGLFTPNELGLNGDGSIVASFMHFTLSEASFPAKPVYEFMRYVITSDNSVNISAQVLDASSFAALGDKMSFNCKIDSGAKIYS